MRKRVTAAERQVSKATKGRLFVPPRALGLARALSEWLVMLLEGHETYANAKSLVDLLHLRC